MQVDIFRLNDVGDCEMYINLIWTPVPLAVQTFNIHMNLSDTMNIKTEINTCFVTNV